MDTLFDCTEFCTTPELPFGEEQGLSGSAALQGAAGEYLVAADISLSGYHCDLVSNLPYDIVIHNGGLWRVQVKTSRLRTNTWAFQVGRHRTTSDPWRRTPYDADDFDILACVLIEPRKIAYLTHSDWDCSKVGISISKHDVTPSAYVGGYSLERALNYVALEEYLP